MGGCWLILLLLLTSCQPRAERTPLQRGAAAYARICAGCHGPTGKGGVRVGFSVPPRDLTDPAFQDSVTDEEILNTLKQGKGEMPAFGKLLPPNELHELLIFVRTLDATP